MFTIWDDLGAILSATIAIPIAFKESKQVGLITLGVMIFGLIIWFSISHIIKKHKRSKASQEQQTKQNNKNKQDSSKKRPKGKIKIYTKQELEKEEKAEDIDEH